MDFSSLAVKAVLAKTLGVPFSRTTQSQSIDTLAVSYGRDDVDADVVRAGLAALRAADCAVDVVSMTVRCVKLLYGDAPFGDADCAEEDDETVWVVSVEGWVLGVVKVGSELPATTGGCEVVLDSLQVAAGSLRVGLSCASLFPRTGSVCVLPDLTATPPKTQEVTPWTVETSNGDAVDYHKLVRDFGSTLIDDELLDRFARVTKCTPHHWLRRGIFFSHRDLESLLDSYEAGESFYLYTGRGPSSDSLHFGHMIPFMFTAWLQSVFRCPLVVQLTDDEKYLFDSKDAFGSMEITSDLGYENAKDILAVGFDPERTFLFSNSDYIGHMYDTVVSIQKKVTFNQVRGIFGFNGSSNIGMVSFPSIQAAPSFHTAFPVVLSKCVNSNRAKMDTSRYKSIMGGDEAWLEREKFLKVKKVPKKKYAEFDDWLENSEEARLQSPIPWIIDPTTKKKLFHKDWEPPQAWKRALNPKWAVDPSDPACLIPCAIDQDPYFRMTRDVASRLKLKKPSLVHAKFFPALAGAHTKMSASLPNTCILLTDDAKTIRKKIMKSAFSGGQDTAEKQRELGADLEVDIAYQWLRFFEEDDEVLHKIGTQYACGKMLTGEIKQILADKLAAAAAAHRVARAQVSDATLAHYMSVRPLEP